MEGPGVARVLASSVPRDVIDDAVAGAGRSAKRSDGKLPPQVMVYFSLRWHYSSRTIMRRSRPGWPGRWARGAAGTPAGPADVGGITRARERLGYEPLRDIFASRADAKPGTGLPCRGLRLPRA